MRINSGEPVYIVIANNLKSAMIDGSINPGDLLPSENELASKFSASRETVRKSLKQLENEGYIYSRPGKGYFVSTPEYGQFTFEFNEDSDSKSLNHLDIIAPPPHVAVALAIIDRRKVIEVGRVIDRHNTPVAYDLKYFPYTRGKPTIEGEINYAIFTEVATAKTSAFAFHTKLQLSVVPASENISKKLNIPIGEPLMLAKRFLIGPDDMRIGYGEKYMTKTYGAINATSGIFTE